MLSHRIHSRAAVMAALICFALGLKDAGGQETITFDGFAAGARISSVFGDGGGGPIQVNGFNPVFGETVNTATIFDSSNPTGGDIDLGTPNQQFGGPGVGAAGASGPFANTLALGNVLIIAENLVDQNNDGLIDDPDDAANVTGNFMLFDFSALGTVTLFDLKIIDVENNEPSPTITLLDAAGNHIRSFHMIQTGDNGVATINLGPTSGVRWLEIMLNGSGAVDHIVFEPDTPGGRISGRVYCDLDDDGVLDPGEPGIGGVTVNLRCAGPDGNLGTGDDFTDSRISNTNGNYLFEDVPPGPCQVRVDVNTAPADKEPGRCPIERFVHVPPGQLVGDIDFCFIKPPPPGQIGDFVFCDLDEDGVHDPGEPGIPGVIVRVRCAGPDGALGTADDFTASDVTDANGFYLIRNVPAGPCEVTVDLDSAPEDKTPCECPTKISFTLQQGQSFLDADFCFSFVPGRIGDFVWCDLDDDGEQDPGEPGIAGVVVRLRCAGHDGILGNSDDLTDLRTTNAAGFYLFTDVPPGFCEVVVDVNSAGDKEVGRCPVRQTVDLAPGQSYHDADFCFIEPPVAPAVFLIIDEDGIDNGLPPNFFSDWDVNDDIAEIGVRLTLRFFANNIGRRIVLHTGEVGDEGWFAPKTIPHSWIDAGPTADGLRNYILAGPGLGSADSSGNRESLLDKIPDVTPLRATGLKLLEGRNVCAIVYDSDVSINYGPLNGNLKGANLGRVAFKVISVTRLTGFSSSSLPQVELEILDAGEVCSGPQMLFTEAPAPLTSSEPFDIIP